MSEPAERRTTLLAMTFVAEDEAAIRQIRAAVAEALERVGRPGDVGGPVADTWSQTGGWVQDSDWSQSGGWYLSIDPDRHDRVYPPLEQSVADVVATFAAIRTQVERGR